MAEATIKADWGRKLVHKITCPNCWNTFLPEEALFISKHPDLLGDEVLGEDQYKRFMPTRFNVKGEAIDPMGFATAEIACPRCYLQVAESMTEMMPLFISLIGLPASGKSYFLATMTWELRRLMPQFMITFTDADPAANSSIHEYETTLFMNSEPDKTTEIRKTQTDDPKLYRRSKINDADIKFPTPLQFRLWPTPSHPRIKDASTIGRVLVMYDNAGEDFLPKTEDVNSAVIQHIAKSQILLMLFDPTQDPRFRSMCQSDDPQIKHGIRPGGTNNPIIRQETILQTAAVRIRKYLGMSQDQLINKPLVIIVPKFDLWKNVAETGISLENEPYEMSSVTSSLAMDTALVNQTSDKLKALFQKLCPEFVATAESLSRLVRYIPISSLGCSPEIVQMEDRIFYGVKPAAIKPRWVTVPLTYCLSTWASGLIRTKQIDEASTKRE